MYPILLAAAALLTVSSTTFAQDRTSEAGEAEIKDPYQECTAYSNDAISQNLASFPTVWSPASIVSGDTEASDKWNEISGSVPDIAPKGTLAGDTSGVTYGDDDPDCWWTRSTCVSPKHDGIPDDIYNVPEPKTLGYGFDDGPNCSHNAFYDYLTEKEQKATMFYIGSNVMNWPLEAERGVTDGHEICVHTWSHRYMTAFESADAFAELWYTLKAIKLVTGVTPTCWRPPFGDVDDRIRAIAEGLGLRTIIWKYDTFDWEVSDGAYTPEQVNGNYQGLIDNVNNGTFDQAGAIILTHEINNYTMQTAMDWYDRLNDAFDNIVPVGIALNITQPYSDRTDITFPTFSSFVGGDNSTDTSTSSSPSASASSAGQAGATTTGSDGAMGVSAPGAVALLSLLAFGSMLSL